MDSHYIHPGRDKITDVKGKVSFLSLKLTEIIQIYFLIPVHTPNPSI